MSVNGTLDNFGAITTTGTLSFNGGSTYQHDQDGGTIPPATWNPSSNCLITGITVSPLGGSNQTFGNVIWNCASQGGTYFLDVVHIAGDLTIQNTNGQECRPTDGTANTVGGSYYQNGGFIRWAHNISSSLTVTGNVFISGGECRLTNGLGTGTLNIKGDLTISGGLLTETGSVACLVKFVNAGTQTFLKTSGAISGAINFSVNSGSTLDVGTSLIDGSTGSFTLNSGAGIITSHAQGLSTSLGTGSIRVSGSKFFNTGADYNYNGAVAQVTGNGLTGANNLTINNSSVGVTLSNPVSVAGTLTLTNGILTTGANLLSLTNTNSSAISGGSITSFIDGPVKWTLPSNLASGTTYNFPLGKGGTYLPFSLVNPTTGAGVATAQAEAYSGNAGGTYNRTLASISTTEYWALITTGSFTNSSVSLTRQTAIAPLDAIGGCSTVAGTYTSLAGTAGTYGVTGSNVIGAANSFFVLAEKLQTISTSVIAGSPFCAGASVSVPFTITGTFNAGNIFTAQLSDDIGSFASPIAIGTLTSINAGTISGTIPPATLSGTLYRILVVSSSPVRAGTDNGSDLSVNPQPVGPTLNIATPISGSVCTGTLVSATFIAGTGGVGCADAYQYRIDGGEWVVYVPGSTLNTTGHTSVDIQGQRAGCTGTGCAGTVWVNLANWTVNSLPTPPSVTNGARCGAGSVTLQAGGAKAGEDYKWYDASTGGTLLQTNSSTFSTPSISSTTNFYVAK